MEGRVMRSIDTHNNTPLFAFPWYICVHPEGHLLVSDYGKNSVICVTSQGQVVWKYTPTGDRALGFPQGITTTPTGDVLLVDKSSNKIIQLSGSGQFVREILTSQDGINRPRGLYLNKHNSLFVCEENGQVKQFKLST
jgi:DNA-binding beta-propeller fold protein YncE